MLGLFMAAFEATAVATAMPTAIAELSGVGRYSWAFSAYLLTSTTTVPLYSKLADLYGRQRIYLIGVFFFLAGSALCGTAQTLDQLILFRAVQGFGAGGVNPVSLTIIGDIYTLEERGRVQGLFSGVWGLASILGPALGGLITDALSWRWVFLINIPFGIGSALMLRLFLQERVIRREHRLDIWGTIYLTAAVTCLLVAMLEGSSEWGWLDARTLGMLAVSIAGLFLFVQQERGAPEPMLPLELFRNPVIAISNAGGVVIGSLLFASTAFVPMFAQGVLGGRALDAGLVLAPMSIVWPLGSALSGRLLIRTGYRSLAIVGAIVCLLGTVLLSFASADTGRGVVLLAMAVIGLGMGLIATPYLVAVQNAVPWGMRGIATGSTQFFRTIAGAISVAAFGALLNSRLQDLLGPAVNANAALNPSLRAALEPQALASLTNGLDEALHAVYLGFVALAVVGVIIAFRFPRGSATTHAHPEARSAG
jgi:EmrB/QacA subfamily drug resistance transporter